MRAAAYCRYSTDNQTENSIMYQLEAIEKYCNQNNMRLVEVYSDEAKTGTNTMRENLQRLLNDCDKGDFETVIIHDQSRLSRNVVDWFTLRETLASKKIKLVSCSQQLSDDVLDSASFLSEGVHAIFSQVHVLETRKKSIAGTTAKARRGEFCGGTPPLGYNIVNGEYVIDEFEAEAIRLIFQKYADGHSYNEIRDMLDEEGYRSKRGSKIGTNAIYYLLINERYTGKFTWNKYRYKQMRKRIPRQPNENYVEKENGLPAIISAELFERVKKRMSENKRGTNKAKREYLLSGMIECLYCGGTYTGFASKNRSSGEETLYYMCGTKGRLKTCTAKNIRADEVEAAVLSILKEDIFKNDLIERTADAIMSVKIEAPGNTAQIKKEIAEHKKWINNIMDALQEGLNKDVGLDRLDDLHLELKTLEARLRAATRTSGKISKEEIIERLKADAERLEGDFYSRRAAIKEYVSKIIISDDGIEIQCIGDYNNTGGATPPYAIMVFNFTREKLKSLRKNQH